MHSADSVWQAAEQSVILVVAESGCHMRTSAAAPSQCVRLVRLGLRHNSTTQKHLFALERLHHTVHAVRWQTFMTSVQGRCA